MFAPAGTLTFLFTDIEGSTRLWQKYPEGMKMAIAIHDQIIRQAIQVNQGHLFKTVGDAFFAAFAIAPQAIQTAVAVQRALLAEKWQQEIPLRVRIALDTGVADYRDNDYFGLPLSRAARLIAAGHGGQVLVSATTQQLVGDNLPPHTTLRDLGVRRLRDLFHPEHIYQLVTPDLPTNFPPLKTLDQRPTNLPAPTTSFIGREKELMEVCDLLRRPETRLLILSGPGGTGKSRLSLQVASHLLDEFEHGIFFVPLTPLHDPALVIPTIAQWLDVPGRNRPSLEVLQTFLQNRQILLVLDNFEQVIPAASEIAKLLAATPSLKILVTSREMLHIYGETEYRVPPLEMPDFHATPVTPGLLAQYPSIALFVERARAVQPDFALTPQNGQTIAELCARLDGLPLALELAAARIKVLSPQAILSRLSNRLAVLVGGGHGLAAHQRTLRDSIDWSYELLDENEKKLFARLAIFVGGWTLTAAEAVGGADALDGLASLLDKSLLQSELMKDAEPRFTMLETIREYAHERLISQGELVEIGRRHASYFQKLTEQAAPELLTGRQIFWLNQLEIEHDNLRAALNWSLSHDQEMAVAIAGSLGRFWSRRGYVQEGANWLAKVLATPAGTPATRAAAYGMAGLLANLLADYSKAADFYEKGFLLGQSISHKRIMARTLAGLSSVVSNQGESVRAEDLRQKALAMAYEADDKFVVALMLNNIGLFIRDQGNYDEALELHQQALALMEEIGDLHILAYINVCLARIALYQHQYKQAILYGERCYALHRQLGDRTNMGGALKDLGLFHLQAGNLTHAQQCYNDSLTICYQIQNYEGVAWAWEGLAGVAAGREQWEYASRLLSMADTLRHKQGATRRLIPFDQMVYKQLLTTIQTNFGEDRFQAVWNEAKTVSFEAAMDLVAHGE